MPDILIKNESGVDEIWPGVNTVRFFDKEGHLVSFRYGGDAVAEDTGHGIPPEGKTRVNFLDFDGNVYQALLLDKGDDAFYPEKDPEKEGYVFVGWNYLELDLEQVKSDIIVGSMWRIAGYTEQDNVFRVRLRNGNLTSGVRWYGSGSNTFEVDWGDGSDLYTFTSSGSSSISHTYATPGDYTIRFRKTAGSGSYWFGSGSSNSSSSYACCNYPSTLVEAQISSDVKYLYSSAFCYCTTLRRVYLPDSIISIYSYCFYQCYNLEHIVIPTQTTSIGYNSFTSNYSLRSISIPKKCTSLGSSLFYYCYSLYEVAIPYGTTNISERMFSDCVSLTYVYLPDTILTVTQYAFSNCYVLEGISRMDNAKSIGQYAFSGCGLLESVIHSDYLSSLGAYAFSGCKNFKKVKVPKNLTVLSSYAYNGCYKLEEVEFADDSSLNIIYDYAFSYCYSMKRIEIPEGVTSIGSYVFQECRALREVVFPSTLTTIYTYPFYYCYSLTDVYLHQTAVPSLSNNPFYNSTSAALRIHVRAELLEAYKAAPYWNNYANFFVGDL